MRGAGGGGSVSVKGDDVNTIYSADLISFLYTDVTFGLLWPISLWFLNTVYCHSRRHFE